MNLKDFKEKLEDFVNQECYVAKDGRIKMQSHDFDIEVDFIYEDEDDTIYFSDIDFEFSQFMGCGCVSGLRVVFKHKDVL